MIKLYGFPGTRSSRVQWLLEEAGAPYELVVVDLRKGEHKQPGHVARHVHGLVPAFEAFPAAKLAPPAGTPERARYYQYVVYAVSTLDSSVIPTYLQERLVPEGKRDASVIDKGKATFAEAATFLSRELGSGPYLLGDAFTAADVAVGYDLALAAQIGLLDDHADLRQYVGRLVERPAFKKAHPQR
jgi:glutathione S-transferase